MEEDGIRMYDLVGGVAVRGGPVRTTEAPEVAHVKRDPLYEGDGELFCLVGVAMQDGLNSRPSKCSGGDVCAAGRGAESSRRRREKRAIYA